ncbi:hypothetical protein [Bradyrhizobium sp. LTSPM299]|uniref:hypothetical protein n=1 Tax=Bradyrhizobium sp. LTSPM299 TaxID=1619233 RepID=UPI000AF68C36|nr:hypothetical protein [Bradyrhizobium sp. LTSPM299]
MVSVDYFRQGLLAQMSRATKVGRIDVTIDSGQLLRELGGRPGSVHGMPLCCEAMLAEMKPGDTLMAVRNNAAGMIVRYRLPRAK